MKVHRETMEEIDLATQKYNSVYNVVFIGKVENGKIVGP